ncbi:MAG TPA: ribulose-phosphate 3-epimerase [Bryobacteraceae bacterium]|nr:ribulose-phosphate 3-epimerase [Bryobacteraceae bacterium]
MDRIRKAARGVGVPRWNLKPGGRLMAEVSLWSADLANLARDVERLSPYADAFHLDVADAHFAPDLLFFPDLVAALRRHTERPFHVHLMVDRPSKIVDRFVAAGADLVTVHCETGRLEVREAISRIRSNGCAAGVALRLETPVSAVEPYLQQISAVLLLGTQPGVKGRELTPEACGRIRSMAALLGQHGLRSQVVIVADGGIRTHTVPELRDAGADAVIAGSLVFQAEDLAKTFAWLQSVGTTA